MGLSPLPPSSTEAEAKSSSRPSIFANSASRLFFFFTGAANSLESSSHLLVLLDALLLETLLLVRQSSAFVSLVSKLSTLSSPNADASFLLLLDFFLVAELLTLSLLEDALLLFCFFFLSLGDEELLAFVLLLLLVVVVVSMSRSSTSKSDMSTSPIPPPPLLFWPEMEMRPPVRSLAPDNDGFLPLPPMGIRPPSDMVTSEESYAINDSAVLHLQRRIVKAIFVALRSPFHLALPH